MSIITRKNCVQTLLEQAARERGEDRRSERRFPFYCPVTVIPYSDPTQRLSAFTRDISDDGIGLLHFMPLPLAPVTLSIPSTDGSAMLVSVEIFTCRPGGQGWYLSGGRFIDF